MKGKVDIYVSSYLCALLRSVLFLKLINEMLLKAKE